MASDNMLVMTVHLDPQPGGIKPELHLKQKTKSMRVRLMVATDGVLSDSIFKPCIIRATLPDGSEFFASSSCNFENRRISITLYSNQVSRMTAAAGRFKCTLTIVNTDERVTRDNYMNYDFMTVLPFIVVVHERAKEE